ncbi:MAG: PEGA domain-containing protein [Polyangia bacterium]
MRTVLGGIASCVVVLSVTGVALARPSRPKLAALILKSGTVDEELADNLTEVLISRLARRGDHEIAGKEELKSKLGVDDRAAADCMQNPSCLGRAGTELGVTRMVVGTLGKRGDDYVYNLNLIDIETGKVENRVFELVAGGKVDTLISAVQSTADKLLEPKVEPGAVRVTSETRGAMVYLDDAFMGSTPVRRDGLEPGTHQLRVEKEGHVGWAKDIEVPAGATMEVKVPLAALVERRRWPATTAASMAVLAGLSGVVGIVLDALALSQTTASTRAGAIQDANVRYLESIVGNVFLGAAAGLALTAAVIVIVYRQDIFGATAREEKASEKKRAKIRPWGLAGLEVRW